MSNIGFEFWRDHHLSHLANISGVDYEIYRAQACPKWEFAETHGSEYGSAGEFFIYRAIGLDDDDCPGLGSLIQSAHESMSRAGTMVPQWEYDFIESP